MYSMYAKLPNLVLGFHGCSLKVRDEVVSKGKHLSPSTNPWDWLGSGVYFWEQNYERAIQWARSHVNSDEEPSVVGAVIDLGNCLNLTDSYYIQLVQHEYELLVEDFLTAGKKLPHNSYTSDLLNRRLDCAVIEHLHSRIRHEIDNEIANHEEFDSARGLFSEGNQIYDGSGFKEKTHVQICVRNLNCIKGYFIPMHQDERYRIP